MPNITRDKETNIIKIDMFPKGENGSHLKKWIIEQQEKLQKKGIAQYLFEQSPNAMYFEKTEYDFEKIKKAFESGEFEVKYLRVSYNEDELKNTIFTEIKFIMKIDIILQKKYDRNQYFHFFLFDNDIKDTDVIVYLILCKSVLMKEELYPDCYLMSGKADNEFNVTRYIDITPKTIVRRVEEDRAKLKNTD